MRAGDNAGASAESIALPTNQNIIILSSDTECFYAFLPQALQANVITLTEEV